MKEKIFQLLKQAYKSLGLGDDVLQAHAEMLDKLGIVTEDNVQTVVESQKTILETLQRENDRRVTEARTKLQAEQKAKEDELKKQQEAEAAAKAEEEKRKAEEEAERKRLEDIKAKEVPEYFKTFMAEQAAKEKQAREEAAKERDEYKKLLAELSTSAKSQKEEYLQKLNEMNKRSEEQSSIITGLQDTIKKQEAAAKAKEEAEAAAKAKAERQAKITNKAKELGIPQSRIDEGFVIAEDATDETITNYLTTVSNNYKTLTQPILGGFAMKNTGEPTKEDVEKVADNLIKNL